MMTDEQRYEEMEEESYKQKTKRWRKAFREAVLERDGHKCRFCDRTENLDAHHITDRHEMENDGYVLSNGITLCDDVHHPMAEKYHISDGEDWEAGMHPDDLYAMIGSSLLQAQIDCEFLLGAKGKVK